jgi:hypothetical protein
MQLYVHLGCVLDGKAESNTFVDKWIHSVPLFERLAIMELIFEL